MNRLQRLWLWLHRFRLIQRLRRVASGARQGWRAPLPMPSLLAEPTATDELPAPSPTETQNEALIKPDPAFGRGPDPVHRVPPRQAGVTLVGHPFLISGRGEDLRAAAGAFASAQLPFDLYNTFDAGQQNASRLGHFRFFERLVAEPRRRAQLFFLNADEMASAHAHLGQEWFSGALRIGYWAWELSRFPDAWLPAFDHVDEVWAPSRFIQQAVSERTDKPVVRMPLVVEPKASDVGRGRFGLPEDQFLFLFFFDFTSFISRKNPYAAIEALQRAFPAGRSNDVGIVVKLNGGQLKPDDDQAFKGHPLLRANNVYLVDEVLSDGEIGALMKACDAFISLHRSEGFGRGPAEAMYFGKPVVTTGYSGNLDYCHEQNCWLVDYQLKPLLADEYPQAEGQVWADPDVEHAAAQMREIVDQPLEVERRVKLAREIIHRHHSPAAVGEAARQRLMRLGVLDDSTV